MSSKIDEDSKKDETKRGFLSRYKKPLIVIVLLYIILTLALVFLSRTDSVPFDYQVF
jgi:hypothetical protein